ncbi:MAG: right-handed parallel beta-helix repeat-containing protein [Planctomycetota bacterium]
MSAGGGIFCSCSALIERNVIRANVCAFLGGGLACAAGRDPAVRDNLIVDNAAGVPSFGLGGGMYVSSVRSIVIERNTVVGNSAELHGAIVIEYLDAGVSGSIVWGNHPADEQVYGALIVNYNVYLTISGSATPGGTLTFESTGTAGLSAMMFVATARGAACHPRFGCFFINFTSPWWLFQRLPISTRVPVGPSPLGAARPMPPGPRSSFGPPPRAPRPGRSPGVRARRRPERSRRRLASSLKPIRWDRDGALRQVGLGLGDAATYTCNLPRHVRLFLQDLVLRKSHDAQSARPAHEGHLQQPGSRRR